jgi:hypothetical protein
VNALVLALVLLGGAVGVAAHPGARAVTASPGDVDPRPTDPARVADPAPAPAAAAPATSSAWVWLIVLGLLPVAVAPRRQDPRRLALTLALLLGVFAFETAIHSVHHLKDPRQAERCPIYSVSQHVAGLSAAPATPDLPPLSPTRDRPGIQTGQLRAPELDGPQSRAPPALPA